MDFWIFRNYMTEKSFIQSELTEYYINDIAKYISFDLDMTFWIKMMKYWCFNKFFYKLKNIVSALEITKFFSIVESDLLTFIKSSFSDLANFHIILVFNKFSTFFTSTILVLPIALSPALPKSLLITSINLMQQLIKVVFDIELSDIAILLKSLVKF